MKYTILFTKMLFISCLLMAMGISVTGCSDDDDELQSGYGYAQFRLYKSASYGNGESGKLVLEPMNWNICVRRKK